MNGRGRTQGDYSRGGFSSPPNKTPKLHYQYRGLLGKEPPNASISLIVNSALKAGILVSAQKLSHTWGQVKCAHSAPTQGCLRDHTPTRTL
jgi:hypothetical protein